MQFDKSKIKWADKKYVERFRALGVKQPFADDVICGHKSVEIRNRKTKYRGDVLICSYKSPTMEGYKSGATIGFAELYDIKAVTNFTAEDWERTRIPRERRGEIKKGFGWFFRNPRRVVEFPVNCKLGLFDLYYTRGIIVEYPTIMILD